MRKSGLQKQIASIFDDVPVPETDSEPMQLPVQQQTASGIDLDSLEDSSAAQDSTVQQQKPSLVQRMAETQADVAHTPTVTTVRPKPLPKTQVVLQRKKSKSTVMLKVKKAVYGSGKTKMDPRQKKMTIVVGMLSLLFVGVLVFSLGGLGQSKAKAADKENPQQESTVQVQEAKPLQWQKPQPLPAELRDPMKPQVTQSAQGSNAAEDGQLVVKGIVFSKNNPSAIIGNKIVQEGETLDGIKIIKINKDSVEFETSEKRWTQQVQRKKSE